MQIVWNKTKLTTQKMSIPEKLVKRGETDHYVPNKLLSRSTTEKANPRKNTYKGHRTEICEKG